MNHKNHGNRQMHHQPQEEVKVPPVGYQIGHNGSHVLIKFERHTEYMALDDAGFDVSIKNLHAAKDMLVKSKLN